MVAQQQAHVRAAIYCRVSTTKQEEEGSSLDTQEASCRRYAAERGYVVDESLVFREVFTGAELWDRPKLSTLRDRVRRRGVDVVIVHDIDRLTRDPVHLGVLLSEAEYASAEIAFVLTPLDSTPEGQLIQYVRGYAAKIERLKIKERSIRGKKARVESGKIHSSATDLYGYRRDKERGVRVIHEPEAEIVRRIFREIVVEGKSIRGVTEALNREGVPSPSADKRAFTIEGGKTARWGKTSITRILRHEAYKGETIVWKQKSDGKGGILTRDESEWIRLGDDVTPAIVSDELWIGAQRLHEAGRQREESNRKIADARNEKAPVLLRGMVFCAVCGEAMYVEPHKQNAALTVRIYRCSSRGKAKGACGGKAIHAEKLDAWVWSQLDAVLRDPAQIADAVAWLREQGPDAALSGDRDSTRRLVDKLGAQQERLARRIADAEDDTLYDLLAKELKRIAEEADQARTRLAEIEHRLAEQEAATVRLEDLQAFVKRVRGNLAELTFEHKRDAVAAMVERVVADGHDPDGWRIEAAIPDLGGVSGVQATTCWRLGRNTLVRFTLPTRAVAAD